LTVKSLGSTAMLCRGQTPSHSLSCGQKAGGVAWFSFFFLGSTNPN
jgi:hypothetical protein